MVYVVVGLFCLIIGLFCLIIGLFCLITLKATGTATSGVRGFVPFLLCTWFCSVPLVVRGFVPFLLLF